MLNGPVQTRLRDGRVKRQRGDITAVKHIPYDYVAKFSLTGEHGRLQEDVINISVEGVFVAQEIGYGFAPAPAEPTLLVQTNPDDLLIDVTLGNLAKDVLITGFRFNPAFKGLVFPNGSFHPKLTVGDAHNLSLLQRLNRVDDLHFLYQIIDSGPGRELQNEPIHNVAGLGKSNGERPFRVLAKPVAFLPRSSIRIQVEEASFRTQGELHIALHGYKILGATDVPESQLRMAPALQRAPAFYGSEQATTRVLRQIQEGRLPRQRLIPFDYVATFDLTGQRENLLDDEVHINVEGGFITTALGYSLIPSEEDVAVSFSGDTDPVDLNQIKLSQFQSTTLLQGFRIRPELVCIAFKNGGLQSLPRETINVLFEPLNQPEDVRFKFRIIDTGTGRELQDKLELNVAGLGIANGARPFRELSYPLHFLPRSSIRVQVEEISGRGRL